MAQRDGKRLLIFAIKANDLSGGLMLLWNFNNISNPWLDYLRVIPKYH